MIELGVTKYRIPELKKAQQTLEGLIENEEAEVEAKQDEFREVVGFEVSEEFEIDAIIESLRS